MSRAPFWDDQCPAARARHEMTDRIDDETNWGIYPVVFAAPVLRQGVDPTASGRGELRVKPSELSIVIGCKAVECVRTPFSIEEAEN